MAVIGLWTSCVGHQREGNPSKKSSFTKFQFSEFVFELKMNWDTW